MLHRRLPAAALTAVAALAVTFGLPVGAATAATADEVGVPADGRIEVHGRGYGHGHGMSQHGAQGAALQGLTYRQIAEFYYPGTSWGEVRGKVRVLITADTSDDVVVSPRSGLSVRDLGDGSTVRLPTGGGVTRWRLVVRDGRTVVQRYDGRWRTPDTAWARQVAGDAEFFAPGPITLWTPSGQRTYRGKLRSARPAAGSTARDTVNVVTMDQYVMGVVPYEMPASWHPQAVRAQAVAARTYATWSRAQNPRRHHQICDTTSCQVYRGVDGEDSRSNEAVAATARQILTYDGRAAFTQFSASSGGWTSAGSAPYLTAQQDPYDGWSGNSVHQWRTVVTRADLERRYPAVGTLRRIRVTQRNGNGDWGGRVDTLVLEGTRGSRTLSGDDFRWAGGLRSRWFGFAPAEAASDTPILRRWREIGGADSVIGDVARKQYAVAGGTAQRFERGKIFHHARTGAWEVYGGVLAAYVGQGGPGSRLGFPVLALERVGKHRLSHFEGGSVYLHKPADPVTVTGRIDARYRSLGDVAGRLGWPTTSNFAVRVGERVNFEHGWIRHNTETGGLRVVYTD
jgi:SpoIID/LytB domain protein